uniref:Uncharacterized protein n=1 Tax=Arundo donax TaxID=35708 RepID=A0A0A9G5A9_ARUDO
MIHHESSHERLGLEIHFLEGSFLLLAGLSCFCSFFLFLSCTWCDLPTNDGCSFNPKLLATWPRWSFFTIKIFFSSPTSVGSVGANPGTEGIPGKLLCCSLRCNKTFQRPLQRHYPRMHI